MSATYMSPILRWAGSKRRLLPLLLKNIPKKYNRYYEPFAGSACLYLATRPSSAVLGDLNAELIGTYRAIRSYPQKVAEGLQSLPTTEEFYYWIRCFKPEDLGEIDRAIRFIYLNRFCFNGVYRTNKLGHFNVPRGTRTGDIPTLSEIENFALVLKQAELRAGDFEKCLEDVKEGDFVYLDPPYALAGKKDRGEYGLGKFITDDIQRLVNIVNKMNDKGAHILVSYAEDTTLTTLFQNWHIQNITVRRSVSGFAKSRGTVKEIFISNFLAHDELSK
jgi:DNA adenine methylase